MLRDGMNPVQHPEQKHGPQSRTTGAEFSHDWDSLLGGL